MSIWRYLKMRCNALTVKPLEKQGIDRNATFHRNIEQLHVRKVDIQVHRRDIQVHRRDIQVHRRDIQVHRLDIQVHRRDIQVHRFDVSHLEAIVITRA